MRKSDWIFVVIGTAILLAALVYQTIDKNNLSGEIERMKAEKAAAFTASQARVDQAFLDGINTCTQEDVQFFYDMADQIGGSGPLVQLLNRWAGEWPYSDDELEDMLGDYKGADTT